MAVVKAPPVALGGTTRRELHLPLRRVDWVLVTTPVLICVIGVVMIYSSTRADLREQGLSELYYVLRQLAGIAIGVVVMALATIVDYRRVRDFVPVLYTFMVAALAGVLVLGTSRAGTQAWFEVGPLQFQPSEIAKVVVVLAVAAYASNHEGDLDAWRLGTALAMAGVPLGLVLLQPDLGTAMVFVVSTLAILLVAGIRAQHLAILVLVAMTLVGVSVATGQLADYQVDRLTGFISQDDTNLTGQGRNEYNLNQSKLAIASGQLTGTGLFEGRQTQLGYVPEQHTDFIFTAVGEELGFVGGATLLALLALLVFRLWRVAVYATDFFGTLLCIGLLAMFAFQIFENVGMTMGIMPITGIPLPFVSYAPSATIAMFAAVGLAASVHAHRFS